MPIVVIYTSQDCPTCDKAKIGLAEQGVEFEERIVEDNPKWWSDLEKYSYTVPVIIWSKDDVQIGWEGEHG